MTRRASSRRCPFFRGPDGGLFVDLLANFGHPLVVEPKDVVSLQEHFAPDDMIIARRLTPAEARLIFGELIELQEDIFGRFMPSDAARWRAHRRRR